MTENIKKKDIYESLEKQYKNIFNFHVFDYSSRSKVRVACNMRNMCHVSDLTHESYEYLFRGWLTDRAPSNRKNTISPTLNLISFIGEQESHCTAERKKRQFVPRFSVFTQQEYDSPKFSVVTLFQKQQKIMKKKKSIRFNINLNHNFLSRCVQNGILGQFEENYH